MQSGWGFYICNQLSVRYRFVYRPSRSLRYWWGPKRLQNGLKYGSAKVEGYYLGNGYFNRDGVFSFFISY
ncbi:unnamed protein product [Toxocara canis]|uniref:Uncharacterized protein n=1 Tax=Toxocara canis TaxID=6265 RepID=A0A183UB71_TOXCA|nr:unnamed protein product [Toxocara canis]